MTKEQVKQSQKYRKILEQNKEGTICPYCNKQVTMMDLATLNFEMAESKRKYIQFVHSECVRRNLNGL